MGCALKNAAPDPWVLHLLGLHLLKSGGYPYGKNDLPPETWSDLGELHLYLEDKRHLQLLQVLTATTAKRRFIG